MESSSELYFRCAKKYNNKINQTKAKRIALRKEKLRYDKKLYSIPWPISFHTFQLTIVSSNNDDEHVNASKVAKERV